MQDNRGDHRKSRKVQGGTEDTGRPAEVETGAGVRVEAGGASREVGSGAAAVWGKGVPLTV